MTQSNSTPNGVEAIAALVLFASPFTVSAGTAGYPQFHHYESTGNSVYASIQSKTNVERYSEKLSAIMEIYGLEKSQLAKLLSASRPAIDSWINKTVSRIRPDNMDRIDRVENLLNAYVREDLRASLGAFLKRELEDESVALISIFSEEHHEKETVQQILEAVNLRLSGIIKSEKLDQLLGENRPAFI